MKLPQILTLGSLAALFVSGGFAFGALQAQLSDANLEIVSLRSQVVELQTQVSGLSAGQTALVRRFDGISRRLLSKGIGDPRRPFTARPPGG